MRVRIAYTVDANDRFRRQINRYYGREGLATREQVRRWCVQFGESMDADLGDVSEEEDDE